MIPRPCEQDGSVQFCPHSINGINTTAQKMENLFFGNQEASVQTRQQRSQSSDTEVRAGQPSKAPEQTEASERKRPSIPTTPTGVTPTAVTSSSQTSSVVSAN